MNHYTRIRSTHFDKYVDLKWLKVDSNWVWTLCLGQGMLFKLKFVSSKFSSLPSQKTYSFDWTTHWPTEESFFTGKQSVLHTQTSQISQLIHGRKEINTNATLNRIISLQIFQLFLVEFSWFLKNFTSALAKHILFEHKSQLIGRAFQLTMVSYESIQLLSSGKHPCVSSYHKVNKQICWCTHTADIGLLPRSDRSIDLILGFQ